MAISRAVWVGETTPEDRVTALRAAFDATMKDPDFLAATKQRKLDLDPTPGSEIDGKLRKALDMLGGFVRVESSPHGGSAFHVALPAAPHEPQAVAADGPATATESETP